MIRYSVAIGVALIAVMGLVAPAQSPKGATTISVDVKEVDTDGLKKLLARNEKNHNPLLVNFWATWCDPCREEFPDLVKVDTDYRRKGLDFIAVSLDDETDLQTAVPKFLQEMKAQMPTYLLNVTDPEPAILAVDKDWGGALPATFLYDGQGKVVFKHFGRVVTNELRAAIEKQLAQTNHSQPAAYPANNQSGSQ